MSPGCACGEPGCTLDVCGMWAVPTGKDDFNDTFQEALGDLEGDKL